MDELFTWCLIHREVDRMLVILPPSLSRWKYDPHNRELTRSVYNRTESLFGKYVLDKMPVTAFPGTDLLGGVASAFIIEFNDTVKDIMLVAEPKLNNWRYNKQPSLPEDICLFKATDSYPTFVSITHEGRAWLINEDRPVVRGVTLEIEKYRPRPEELIFEGKYFCREFMKKR